MQPPAPPFSRPSSDNGVMTASRFQGLFLTARVRSCPIQMGPHRTVPRLQLFRGAQQEGQIKKRPSRHDLLSDVEAHVDGLASLALVITNRPLTHSLLCRPCRSLLLPA